MGGGFFEKVLFLISDVVCVIDVVEWCGESLSGI